jgi:hypothetical protein
MEILPRALEPEEAGHQQVAQQIDQAVVVVMEYVKLQNI